LRSLRDLGSGWFYWIREVRILHTDQTQTEIIHGDHELWMKCDDLADLGSDYGARVVKTYEEVLDQIEAQVFEGMKLTHSLKSDLRKTVSFMFGKQWFHRIALGSARYLPRSKS
jgi:hypothetical protein